MGDEPKYLKELREQLEKMPFEEAVEETIRGAAGDSWDGCFTPQGDKEQAVREEFVHAKIASLRAENARLKEEVKGWREGRYSAELVEVLSAARKELEELREAVDSHIRLNPNNSLHQDLGRLLAKREKR